MLKAILFDKDGTLINLEKTWFEPTYTAIKNILEVSNIPSYCYSTVFQELGIDDNRLIPNSMLASGTTEEQIETLKILTALDSEYIEKILFNTYQSYIANEIDNSVVIEGAFELLNKLKESYYLGLITNDSSKLTYSTLDKTNLLKYFDFIGCADVYGPKPNPKALDYITRETGIKLNEMVYVGDSIVDIEYGQYTAASIIYLNNSNQVEALNQADYFVENLVDVLDIIDQINSKKEG